MKSDKLIKDSQLVERLDKLDPDNASGIKDDGINYWKGKKIVSLADWKKKIAISSKAHQKGVELHRIKEALQYFPDDYDQSLFPFPVPAEPVPDEIVKMAEKWRKWYFDLMYYRNNSKCGRSLCSKCLLCTDKEKSGKYVGISKLVARAIEVNNNDEKEGEGNSNFGTCTSTQSLYPCSVLNRFKCPYQRTGEGEEAEEDANSFDVDYLFLLASYCSRVESALIKARKVNSIVQIMNVEDIYNALNDRETLDKLLQQGLDDSGLKYKEEIVDFFMSIKDDIRIEELTFHNSTDA